MAGIGVPELLEACAALLCCATGHASFSTGVLDSLSSKAVGRGPCTNVWTAGSVAYRCRTCQVTSSSAVCISCFKAGGHDGHDYVLYRSPAGGCCDCGDLSSWALEGCCPAHRPTPSDKVASHAHLVTLLNGPAGLSALHLAVCACVAHLSRSVAVCTAVPAPSAVELGAAESEVVELCKWLCTLASLTPTRPLCCELAAASFSELSTSAASFGVSLAAGDTLDGLQALAAKLISATDAALMEAMQAGASTAGAACTLLRSLFTNAGRMREEPLQEATTLLLLLLYDNGFKHVATVELLACYHGLLGQIMQYGGSSGGGRNASGARHPVGTALDRLTVQLFNSEDVTLRLVRDERLLEVMLGMLQYLITHGLDMMAKDSCSKSNDNGQTRMDADAFQALFSCYRRVLGDLNTILHHPSVVTHMLITPDRATWHQLLGCVRLMQGMAPHIRRQEAQGALPEGRASVTAAINLEVTMASSVAELVATASATRNMHGQAALTPHEALAALESAASEALTAASEWSAARMEGAGGGALEPGSTSGGQEGLRMCGAWDVWQRLLDSSLALSPHLPLHRTAGAFLQALLVKENSGVTGAQEAVARVLNGLRAPTYLTGALSASAQPCAHRTTATAHPSHNSSSPIQATDQLPSSPQLVPAWQPLLRWLASLPCLQSQVHSRLWIRNTDDALVFESFYTGWREYGADLDALLALCTLAAAGASSEVGTSTPQGTASAQSAVLVELFATAGAGPLLQAAGVASPSSTASGGSMQLHLLRDLISPKQEAGARYAAAQLGAVCDALRMLVGLLRERTLCGASPRHRMQHALLHALALHNHVGHARLADLLPADLSAGGHADVMDEVLREIAVFRPPNISTGGTYSLARSAWEQWDPYWLGYSRRQLERAWEAAINSGAYKAHWSCRDAVHALPASLQPARKVLGTPQLWRIASCILQAAVPEAALLPAAAHIVLPPPPVPAVPEELLLPTLALLGLLISYAQEVAGQETSAWRHDVSALALAALESGTAMGWSFSLGILPLLEGLQHSAGPVVAARAGSRPHLTKESLDCVNHLLMRGRELLATSQAVCGVVAPPNASSSRSGAADAATGAHKEAEAQRKAQAKAHQVEIMARMRAQQQAAAAAFNKEQKPGITDGSSEASGGHDGIGTPSEKGEEEEGEVSDDTDEDGANEEGQVRGMVNMEAGAKGWLSNMWRPSVHALEGGSSCVICKHKGNQRRGPLGLIAHVSVCSSMATAIHNCSALHSHGDSCVSRCNPAQSSTSHMEVDGAQGGGDDEDEDELTQEEVAGAMARMGALQAAQQKQAQGANHGTADETDGGWALRLCAHGPGASSSLDWQPGHHVLACGHLAHVGCFTRHRDTINLLAASNADFPGRALTAHARGEIMCPVCRRLSNCILPAAEHTSISIRSSDVPPALGRISALTQLRAMLSAVLEQAQLSGGRVSQSGTPSKLDLMAPLRQPLTRHSVDMGSLSRGHHTMNASTPHSLARLNDFNDMTTRTAVFGTYASMVASLCGQVAREASAHTAYLERALDARAIMTLADGSKPSSNHEPTTQTAQSTPEAASGSSATSATQAALHRATTIDIPLSSTQPYRVFMEPPADVRKRWAGDPVVPALWAALAHALAHFEAARRPLETAPVLAEAASPQPSHSPKARQQGATSTCAGGAPGSSSGLSTGGAGSSDSVTGLGVWEAAHWRATTSLASLCVGAGLGLGMSAAVKGAGPSSSVASGVPSMAVASAAAQDLAKTVAWLLGANVSMVLEGGSPRTTPVGASPVCSRQDSWGSAASPNDDAHSLSAAGSPTSMHAAVDAAAVWESDPNLSRALAGPLHLPLLGLSSHLLPWYDGPSAAAALAKHFAEQRDSQRPRKRIMPAMLHVFSVERVEDLAADPMLLLLELTCAGLRVAGATSAAAAAQGEPQPDNTVQLPVTAPCTVMCGMLEVVLPIAAAQAAVWSVTSGPLQAAARQAVADLRRGSSAGDGHYSAGGVSVKQLTQVLHSWWSATTDSTVPLLEVVATQCLPLLVRAYALSCALCGEEPNALLMRQYSRLPVHPAVQELVGGRDVPSVDRAQSGLALADALCARMNVQSVSQALAGLWPSAHVPGLNAGLSTAQTRVLRWAGHVLWAARTTGPVAAAASPPPAAPSMALTRTAVNYLPPLPCPLPLPPLFQDLYLANVESAKCSGCGAPRPMHPSLCLLTGKLLCSWWRGCGAEGQGGGLLHAAERCGGTTLMLSLRSTKVVVLRPTRLAIAGSPYLDAHGEEDADLRRGRPLFLESNVLRQLARLWSCGALEFDSHIIHASRTDAEML